MPPKNGRIESRYSGEDLDECSIKLGGQEYTFNCKSGRNTIHLSANHEVGTNDGGSWNKVKCAVIIPFEDLKRNSTIKSAKSVDTYKKGSAQLTENSYILCLKGENKVVQKNKPGVTVIEYEGKSVQDYANILISELVYKYEQGNGHGFDNQRQAKIFFDIVTKEGLTTQSRLHSKDKKIRENMGRYIK